MLKKLIQYLCSLLAIVLLNQFLVPFAAMACRISTEPSRPEPSLIEAIRLADLVVLARPTEAKAPPYQHSINIVSVLKGTHRLSSDTITVTAEFPIDGCMLQSLPSIFSFHSGTYIYAINRDTTGGFRFIDSFPINARQLDLPGLVVDVIEIQSQNSPSEAMPYYREMLHDLVAKTAAKAEKQIVRDHLINITVFKPFDYIIEAYELLPFHGVYLDRYSRPIRIDPRLPSTGKEVQTARSGTKARMLRTLLDQSLAKQLDGNVPEAKVQKFFQQLSYQHLSPAEIFVVLRYLLNFADSDTATHFVDSHWKELLHSEPNRRPSSCLNAVLSRHNRKEQFSDNINWQKMFEEFSRELFQLASAKQTMSSRKDDPATNVRAHLEACERSIYHPNKLHYPRPR